MNRIEHVAIVGMGALGLLFGERIAKNIGNENLFFLMDQDRKRRHAGDIYRINGKEVRFRIHSPEEIVETVDLVIIATKYSGLYEAREMIRPITGENTVIVSLLNGISSEEILGGCFPREQIIDCVAIGMDAVRNAAELTYDNMGRWQLGCIMQKQKENLDRLVEFLSRVEIPYEICADILRTMWNKFMINVGINQTCMVYRTGYKVTASSGRAYDDLSGAMHEVIKVAAAEGVHLTEEDFEKDLALLKTLNPDGCPSMRQDALAGRKSEVELFAGTMLKLAHRHNIEVPVNERYYRIIKKMESFYDRFEFRDVRAEEADETAQMEQICFPPNEACTPEMMKKRIEAAPQLFLVAVDKKNGRIAGFLNGLSTNEEVFRDEYFTDPTLYQPEGKNVMLLGLDVLPEYRRQGLATELVQAYADRERQRGRERLILTCLEEKVEMYRKMGLRDLGMANSSWGGERWHEMDMALSI